MDREERLKASYDRLLAAGKITQEQYEKLTNKNGEITVADMWKER